MNIKSPKWIIWLVLTLLWRFQILNLNQQTFFFFFLATLDSMQNFPWPLQLKCRVLTIGPPGKSLRRSFSLRISIYGKKDKEKSFLALFYLVFKSENTISFFLKLLLHGSICLEHPIGHHTV